MPTFGVTWPENITAITDNIRGVIGRNIMIFVNVSGTACPVCDLDPVTDLATDPWCPICGGSYWIDAISGVTYSAHVHWGPAYQPRWVSGGVIDEGDCTITIKNTDAALEHVRASNYYVVDTRDLYMKNYELRGAPAPNRIRITLLEDKE